MQVKHIFQLLLGPVILADFGTEAVHPALLALVGRSVNIFKSFLHLLAYGIPALDAVSFYQCSDGLVFLYFSACVPLGSKLYGTLYSLLLIFV